MLLQRWKNRNVVHLFEFPKNHWTLQKRGVKWWMTTLFFAGFWDLQTPNHQVTWDPGWFLGEFLFLLQVWEEQVKKIILVCASRIVFLWCWATYFCWGNLARYRIFNLLRPISTTTPQVLHGTSKFSKSWCSKGISYSRVIVSVSNVKLWEGIISVLGCPWYWATGFYSNPHINRLDTSPE